LNVVFLPESAGARQFGRRGRTALFWFGNDGSLNMRKLVFCVIALAMAVQPALAGEVHFAGKVIDEADLEYYKSITPKGHLEEGPKQTSFGPSNWSSWIVGPSDAGVRGGSVTYDANGRYLKYNAGTGTASFLLPIHLPHGALVQHVYVYFFDNDPGASYSMGFYAGHHDGTDTLIQGMDPAAAFDGGVGSSTWSLATDHTANNWDNHYYILALFPRTATTEVGLYKIIVWYRLQVSPAPGSATFGDVPLGHFFFQEIEAMADSGISGGCGSGNFCPDDPVTRAQMAAFLSRALGLSYPADVTP
jgi:hypothetical protein